jgi:hypothetical protein
MNLDRHNLENNSVKEILHTFEELTPIEAHDYGNSYKISAFLSILNNNFHKSKLSK